MQAEKHPAPPSCHTTRCTPMAVEEPATACQLLRTTPITACGHRLHRERERLEWRRALVGRCLCWQWRCWDCFCCGIRRSPRPACHDIDLARARAEAVAAAHASSPSMYTSTHPQRWRARHVYNSSTIETRSRFWWNRGLAPRWPPATWLRSGQQHQGGALLLSLLRMRCPMVAPEQAGVFVVPIFTRPCGDRPSRDGHGP